MSKSWLYRLEIASRLIVDVCVLVLFFVGLFFVWQQYWNGWQASVQAAGDIERFRIVQQASLAGGGMDAARYRGVGASHVVHSDRGSVVGLLHVDRWVDVFGEVPMPIRYGTDARVLRAKVAGLYPGMSGFGEPGNTGLAGHRRGRGNSFEHIDSLVEGDVIRVETIDKLYTYRVVGHEVVAPNVRRVLFANPIGRSNRVDGDRSFLTLTSCHSLRFGKWGNDHRWVVYALLESTERL